MSDTPQPRHAIVAAIARPIRPGRIALCAGAALMLPAAAGAAVQPIQGFMTTAVNAAAQAVNGGDDVQGSSGLGPSPRAASASSASPPGSYGAGNVNASANLSTARNGTVGASAQATGYGGGGGANAHVVYELRLIGEDRPGGVPYTISAFGYANSIGTFDGNYGSAWATATFKISGLPRGDGGYDQIVAQASSGEHAAQGYVPLNFSERVMLPTNMSITVSLDVEALASAGTSAGCENGEASCDTATSAFLDPYFVIDPAFAADYVLAAPFLLEMPGANPPGGSAVPEPASWALMLAGFGMVGVRMRRRAAPKALPA